MRVFFNVKKADKIIFIMLALMDLYVCALGGWHIKAPELPLPLPWSGIFMRGTGT